MPKVRLCYIVSSLEHMGGSVRVAVALANRFARDDYDVSIVSCEPFSDSFFALDENVRAYTLDVNEGRVIERARMARRPLNELLVANSADIVFGIGAYETLFAIRPCRDRGIPLVFCDHGALINQWDDKKMRLIRLLNAMFSKKVITLTEESLRDYSSMLRVPSTKVRCIPNWVPQSLVDANHIYDTNSKRLLWAGRLDAEKGVDLLVEIAKRVLPSRPEWLWDVYGEEVIGGDFKIVDALSQAGLTKRVRLMGRANNMFSLYDNYAAFTLTSYREGLPLTLLEAKACGLPLISFDVHTGPRDIISDGVDGFLIRPYDCEEYAVKLGQMMDDDCLRQTMSTASALTIDGFAEKDVYAKWVALVDELV